MSRRLPPASCRPTALCGCSGHGGRRRVLAWLAILAILVQTIVPDFAMAARAAGYRIGNAVEAAAAHDCHQESGEPELGAGSGMQMPTGAAHSPQAPAGGDDHGAVCPFCLALGTHGLITEPGGKLPVPAFHYAVAQPQEAGVRPRLLFLTCLHPRAPPGTAQV